MGTRNQEGIGLSYRPASLCSLATQFQTRLLESICRPKAVLKFRLCLPASLASAAIRRGWTQKLLKNKYNLSTTIQQSWLGFPISSKKIYFAEDQTRSKGPPNVSLEFRLFRETKNLRNSITSHSEEQKKYQNFVFTTIFAYQRFFALSNH
jgi:hypothetical protein